MIRVIKGNKELQIDEINKQYYLDEGYNVINEKGKVLEYGNDWEKEYEELLEENKRLKKELDKLKGGK